MTRQLSIFLVFILSACQAQSQPPPTSTAVAAQLLAPEDNPFAPKPEDAGLVRAGVILISLDLSESADTTSSRSKLSVLGSMPSVCNELRIKVDPPNPSFEIRIDIYSVINPRINCENVFQQFDTSILLGKYSAGVYSIWVNSSFVGNIVSY